MLGLFDCLGNRVAVYKSWRSARIGEAKRKHKLWVLWDSISPDVRCDLLFVYQIRPLTITVE